MTEPLISPIRLDQIPRRGTRDGLRLRECSPLHVSTAGRNAAARETTLVLGGNYPRLGPLRRSRACRSRRAGQRRAGCRYLGFTGTAQTQHPDSAAVRPVDGASPSRHSGLAAPQGSWPLLDSLGPPNPCWHLNSIGVDPSAQRSGLGSALINHMLPRIDDDALPAFLDTSQPDNLGYYERFGFRVTAESALPNGTPLWGMTRQAGLHG